MGINDKFTPKLYYALLVSHHTTVEGDYNDPIPVPKSVKQVQITVHTFNGTQAREEQIWRELNSHGYYSYEYKITNWWEPVPEDQHPF